MSNLTVGLFGIHYKPQYKHWMEWVVDVDYRKTYTNNKEYIYDLINPTIYSTTYFSDVMEELNNHFHFHKLLLKSFDETKSASRARNENLLDTLYLLENTKEDVILTRYDLLWNTSPLQNIKQDKINVVCGAWWGDDSDLVDDNFYYIPNYLLTDFTNMVKENLNSHSHQYHKHIDIHKIDNKHYYSHENPFYTIMRNIHS